MTTARKVTQLTVTTPDATGTLGKITTPLAKAGINIEAFCVYGMEGTAYCMFVTSNPGKATETLKNAGYTNVTTNDAVRVETESRAGTLSEISNQLGEAGIYIEYCYASTGNGNNDTAIFVTKDNDKAITTLGG